MPFSVHILIGAKDPIDHPFSQFLRKYISELILILDTVLTHTRNKNIKQFHVISINTTRDYPCAPLGGGLPMTRAPHTTL